MSLIGRFTPLPDGPCLLEIYCMERQSKDWCEEVERQLRAELAEKGRRDDVIVFCQPGIWLRIKRWMRFP